MRMFWRGEAGSLAVHVLLALAALVVASGCTEEEEEPRVPVIVPTPVQQALPATVGSMLGSYSGGVVAIQQVSLSPRMSGQIVAMHVDVGSQVRAGDALAVLDAGVLQAQLFQAQAALQSAQARLDQMLAGPRASDLASARSALEAAETKLTLMLNPSPVDIAVAEAAFVSAEVAHKNAQSAVANTKSTLLGHVYLACNSWGSFGIPCGGVELPLPPSVVDAVSSSLQSNVGSIDLATGSRTAAMLSANESYRAALANVSVMEAALQSARVRRAAVGNPPVVELAAQRSAIEQARGNFEARQQPSTEADVQAARAGVAQAQASLAVARANVEQAVIAAPFDGTIAQRMLSTGAVATAQTPVFTLVGRAVEVRLAVEDNIAARVRRGDKADVSVSAVPGKSFTGEVSIVSPIADARTHLVDVHVLVGDPEALLKPGMAARVVLTAAR